jgi:sulfur-oxidizing protein SoxX
VRQVIRALGFAASLIASCTLSGQVRAQGKPVGMLSAEDGIGTPLADLPGDVATGRRIVVDRQKGACLLCHSGPFPEERFQGDLAPDLSGAGSRWSVAQLRLRLAAPHLVNPETIMPSYLRSEGFVRIAPALRGRPILTEQEIEDVVALLATLK